jgi:hypothetical protein
LICLFVCLLRTNTSLLWICRVCLTADNQAMKAHAPLTLVRLVYQVEQVCLVYPVDRVCWVYPVHQLIWFVWLIVVSVAIVVLSSITTVHKEFRNSFIFILGLSLFLYIVIVFFFGIGEIFHFGHNEIPHSEIPLESPCVRTWYILLYVENVPSLLQAILPAASGIPK